MIFSTTQAGYLSLLYIQMTPYSTVNYENVTIILLRIEIEGFRFERSFEYDANLTYIFSWDKRNVYKQKVYGLTEAAIAVGYVFQNCPHSPVWTQSKAFLRGFSSIVEDFGGWNLNVYHKLDITHGML